MDFDGFSLFSMQSSRALGERISESLGLSLSEHEERDFEDGEHKCRALANVRNHDVFIVSSLYGDGEQSGNDKLCRLLFFIGAIRDASAARITAVVPYLCYARKDRQTKTRDPVTTRYVARLFESVGVDHFVTMDVHNLTAYQNAFHRATTDHLQAVHLFVDHFGKVFADEELVIASPDVGGVKRAALFRQAMMRATGRECATAFMEKSRSRGIVRGDVLVGDVKGKTVILVDDLISSGGTLARAAAACRQRGAVRVDAAATHGLFVSDAESTLGESALEQIVIADTVPPFRLSQQFVSDRLTILGTADSFARAIGAVHRGESMMGLMEFPD